MIKHVSILFLGFLIVAGVVFNSCTTKNPDIFAGEHEFMNIANLDTVIGSRVYDLMTENYFMDVNGDGVNDFKLVSEQGYWHGPTHAESRIVCLHDSILLQVYAYNDTVYFRKTYSSYQVDGLTIYTETRNYTCEYLNASDSVHLVSSKFQANVLAQGDRLEDTELWESTTLRLTRRDYSYPSFNSIETPDTTYQFHTIYVTDCHDIVQNQTVYIIFKLVEDKGERLGWLKLSVSDDHLIQLMEVALAKKLLNR